MMTRSGGDYAYVYEAFGPFYAFLRMWVECLVIKPTLTAIQVSLLTHLSNPGHQSVIGPIYSMIFWFVIFGDNG